MIVARAMEVLDLLLTFQFNTRLESFIAKFKTAETSRQAKSIKQQNTLVALLGEDFSPFNPSKYVTCYQYMAQFVVKVLLFLPI